MVIDVISGGSKVSGITHVTAKKSTRSAKNDQETGNAKRVLLGTVNISFTTKEQEKVLASHHDILVVSLMVVNFLVKRILVDNGNFINVIFLIAYNDLELEKDVLTLKVTPLIGYCSKVNKQ